MLVPNRHGSSESYRYGFNGQEKDDELKGDGNFIAYADRGYDPRIGRFISVDAFANAMPSQSPYSYALNNPIYFVDDNGNWPKPSELLPKDTSPLIKGMVDGVWEGLTGSVGFAYDYATDSKFRETINQSFTALISDPMGTLGGIVEEYAGKIERLATGNATDADVYDIGTEIGEAGIGVLLGGATLGVKAAKKILKPDISKSKLAKESTKDAKRVLDGPAEVGGRKTRTPTKNNKNIDHTKTKKNSDGTVNYTDVNGNTVKYSKNGHPDLSPYAKAEVEINNLTGNSTKDAILANKAVGLKSTPDEYTWHHASDGKTMQLVPTEINKNFPHTGGAAIVRDAQGSN
jgi:RHS repeat-associated protein